MSPEFDEVLLTAFLDDEVTKTEREAVEEQLRTSESSRKLLEELRSVRNLVMQLHHSQPSRSFQNGPWNETPLPPESAKVVLNESRLKWNSLTRRIASIAALIAIAVCSSVLVIRPNAMSLSRSERTNTVSEIDALKIEAGKPLDQPIPPEPTIPGFSLSLEMKQNETPEPRATGADSPNTKAKKDDAMNPLVQTLLRSLSVASTDNKSDWIAVNALGDIDASITRTDPLEGEHQQRSLGRRTAVDSKELYSFRYTRATERGKVADKNANLQKGQADGIAMQWDEAKEIAMSKEVPLSSVIEFQIPSADWGAGAMRLRDLGIDVPLELPSVDYVDFTAIPMPDSNDGVIPLARRGTDKQSEELSRWRFRIAEPQERPFARIRVRALKKE
jgi:hypothetical protein